MTTARPSTCIVLVALACAAVRLADAWRSEGNLPQGFTSAQYVGKFCFDYRPWPEARNHSEKELLAGEDDGLLSIDVSDNSMPLQIEATGELYFMIFDDESEHWPHVRSHWGEMTCEDFKKAANWEVPLSPRLASPPHRLHTRVAVHEHVRPRFWYFVFINCGEAIPSSLSYSLHAWNPFQGDQAEFSIDQHNALPLDLVFLFLYGAVSVTICVVYNLPCEWRARPLLMVLQASAACSAFSCCTLEIHNSVYARDGLGLPFAQLLSVVFACAAKALLAVLMCLLARGWSLLTAEDDSAHRTMIAAAFVGIVVLSVGCEIHGQYFHDQSTSLYLYESWPGLLILLLNLCLFGMALRLLRETYKKEASGEFRSFYRLMAMVNTFYFATLPAICTLAFLLDPWVRRKFVDRAELGTRLAAIVMLLYFLWPTLLEARLPARPAKSGAEPLDFEEPIEDAQGMGLVETDSDH
jgi:hypothetical protein